MANIGFGATLSVNDGTSGAVQAFDEVVTITFPAAEAGVVESTNLTSANKMKTFVGGMMDPGSLSWEQNYNKSDYLRLLALKGNTNTYTIAAPHDAGGASATFTLTAILLKSEMSFEADQVSKIKCEAKVSGPITIV